jgi:hypothetical protein
LASPAVGVGQPPPAGGVGHAAAIEVRSRPDLSPYCRSFTARLLSLASGVGQVESTCCAKGGEPCAFCPRLGPRLSRAIGVAHFAASAGR